MSVSVETLAAHLHRHASAQAAAHAAIEREIDAEHAARRDAEAAADALRSELAQYHGWLHDEQQEGGAAYRMSKAVHEEMDRRVLLEEEVAALRVRLHAISGSLQRLSEQAAAAPPDAVLHSSAGDALRHLKLLARLGSEGSRGGGDKGVSAAS